MKREERDKQFKYLLDEYVNDRKQSMSERTTKYTQNRFTSLELECRFGTVGRKIQRSDYRQLVERLKSIGWRIQQDQYYMRITPEFVDQKGNQKMSNIRVELEGIHEIQKYCKSNTLNIEKVQFVQKQTVRGEEPLLVNYPDFGFRVALSTERTVSKQSRNIQAMIQSWNDKKKVFRLIQRITMVHPQSNVQIDLSIVRTSSFRERRMVSSYTVQESNVMTNPEIIELECEVNLELLSRFIMNDDVNTLLYQDLKRTIKHCLSAIQDTNYPISNDEQNRVLKAYRSLMVDKPEDLIRNKHFCGPSSISLEQKHIVPLQDDQELPNIRMSYTVTDKADGQRKLLYIDSDGKLYMIDTNMRVQFTGSKTENTKLFNTLLDGEYIPHNKKGEFINLYASFDVYFNQKKDLRAYAFLPTTKEKKKYRHPIMNSIVQNLQLVSVNSAASPLRVKVKTFYSSVKGTNQIFQKCNTLLQAIDNGQYEYETDGLIFTPMDTGVGMDTVGEQPINTKRTWLRSFKWKPPEYNTVDFLVTFNKENENDVVGTVFEEGELYQFKKTTLRVGFDENVHGYRDPCKQIIENDMPKRKTTRAEQGSEYKAVPFVPSDPYNPNTSQCNLMLTKKGTETIITTHEGDLVEDNTIVEFSYDKEKPEGWRWRPLRVRYDKTAELRRGGKNYGNAYHVAESVWRSIHYPVTEDMIRTGDNIPSIPTTDKTPFDQFKRYVREKLMQFVNEGQSIYAMNIGNAEDMPFFVKKKLSYVFGTDINRERLFNRLDGACARYLDLHKEHRTLPSALFAQADLSRPWDSAFYSDKGKQMAQSMFGKGNKDRKFLGDGIYKLYRIVEDGFDMITHHQVDRFFQEESILNTFAETASKVCKIGGYFTGCMLDGGSVFEKLENLKENESTGKQWRLIKRYDTDSFDDEVTSLGLEVHIEHENVIRKTYLANIYYFIKVMENYGFVLISKSLAKEHGLSPSGMYKKLLKEYKNETGQKMNLGVDKEYALLHRFFVFQRKQLTTSNLT